MEDLSADDDILSDILLDTLEFEPAISTHKMNPNYRGQRFDRGTVSLIVRKRVVVERDISAALDDLYKLGIVVKYLQNKTQRQTAGFHAHARRYLETYLPDSGVEFALTTRYKRVVMEKMAARASAVTGFSTTALTESPGKPGELSSSAVTLEMKIRDKGKGRHSLDRAATSIGAAPAASEKADLCVLAMHDFKPGDLIAHCKGGLKDLTKSEDEALREEAVSSREKRKEAEYKGVLGPGRDFSVISSSRKGCSQLLLGPARFVNHDCNPNTEFYRMGAQMIFKVIRPIARNEEITTYYGDNYFEWANSECMCATCELKGIGAFADRNVNCDTAVSGTATAPPDDADPEGGDEDKDGASESNGDGRRRLPRRVGRSTGVGGSNLASPSPTPSAPLAGSNSASDDGGTEGKSRRDILADIKLAQHGPSEDRSDPFAEGAGPKCRCLTCGATFWAPEKWWTPDECPRCERHYKIFKADWPDRIPTEGLLARKGSSGKRKFDLGLVDRENDKPGPHSATPISSEANSSTKKRARTAKAVSNTPGSSPAVTAAALNLESPAAEATPVTLTPLREAETSAPRGQAASSSSKTKPKELLSASKAAVSESSKSIVSKGAGSTPPQLVAQQAAKQKASNAGILKGSKGAPPRQESEDSDLTPESESDSDHEPSKSLPPKDSSAAASVSVSARSSSSASPGPMGPKMLGKNAKTDILARYWGAPSTDKRSRRKSSSHNGPVLLGVRKGLSGAESRRSTSDKHQDESDSDEAHSAAARKASRKRHLQSTPDPEEADGTPRTGHALSSAAPKASHRKTASMSDLAGLNQLQATSAANVQIAAVPQGPTKQPAQTRTGEHPSRQLQNNAERKAAQGTPVQIPGLATTGVERTSESNLALFWSAGVEGGRTRRQVAREPQTLTATQTPAKRSRPGSESSRSRTPEVKRPRPRHSKNRISDSPLDEDATSAPPTRGEVKAEGNIMHVDSDDDGESDDERKPMGGQSRHGTEHAHTWTHAVHEAAMPVTKTPLLPPAPLMRPPAFVRPDLMATAARSNSPLAGPPPSGVRPGAPGQPIRKNLRWGSGKTSLSRPLGTVSPLGRPLLEPNGSPVQALPRQPPLDSARVLNFAEGSAVARANAPTPDAGNGVTASASASAPPGLSASVKPELAPGPVNLPSEDKIPLASKSIKAEQVPDAALCGHRAGFAGDHARRVGSGNGNGSYPLGPSAFEESKAMSPSAPAASITDPGAQPQGATVLNDDPEASRALLFPSTAQDPGIEQAVQLSTPETLPMKRAPASPPQDEEVTSAHKSEVTSADVSPGASESGMQRRVSGRARKPPEMAAGQIQYRGSLVKLAAKRAKEAKQTDSPGSRSAARTPQYTPPLASGPTLLGSPKSPDKLDKIQGAPAVPTPVIGTNPVAAKHLNGREALELPVQPKADTRLPPDPRPQPEDINGSLNRADVRGQD